MKLLIVFIFFVSIGEGYGQQLQTINIKVNKDQSTYFNDNYKASVDSAFIIANAVFNSQEFQTMLNNVAFPYWNECQPEKCKPSKTRHRKEAILGKEIYEKLFKEKKVFWAIHLEEKSKSALGATCPNTGYTTAYFKNIKVDMPNLPFSYALAVNLCHEYMHQIGFCHHTNSFNEPDKEHPDPNGFRDDISYRVGWESYYILKKWYEAGGKISGL